MDKHPRDRFLTIVGRKPVLEALQKRDLHYGELLIDRKLRKESIGGILDAAKAQNIKPIFCDQKKVHRRSKSPKQDQGVALDIETPLIEQLEHWV